MNAVRTLFEKFWICKDTDKEDFYKVKREISIFQKFVGEQLGWKLIHTENLLKLEKIPAHAESFMGIQDFTDILDYCILCVVLMYLEDREEGEQFLLSELLDYVETKLKGEILIDWTSFAQRKALVRTLQYMERMQMLRVYEGSSEAFGLEQGQEVLYENTGYSKYFAVNFPMDISEFETWEDFEKQRFEEIQEDRGSARINRVYRQLAVCPAMYWNGNEDADSLYLKNQRQWIARYLEENLGGKLDIYKNAAFFMLEEDDCYGNVHPRDAMLPEIVLLVCTQIRQALREGKLVKQDNETIMTPRQRFSELILECRKRWGEGWSKEYREIDDVKLVDTVINYMKGWMLLREDEDTVIILPAAGRQAGYYPKDFEEAETD